MHLQYILIIITSQFYNGTGILSCLNGWTMFGNFCYRDMLLSTPVQYDNATSVCQDENPNATLIMPKTQAENRFIFSNISKSNVIWIGLTNSNSSNEFAWYDGTELSTFNNWGTNQPVVSDGNCVATNRQLYSKWYALSCLMEVGVICQMDPENVVEIKADNTTSLITAETSATLASGINRFFTAIDISTRHVETSQMLDTTIQFTTENFYPSQTTDHLSETQTSTSLCACDCKYPVTNFTKTNLEDILNNIKVDKKMLSSEIRKRISVQDQRVSSFCIGCFGSCTLVVCCGLVVVLDCAPKRQPHQTKKYKVNL